MHASTSWWFTSAEHPELASAHRALQDLLCGLLQAPASSLNLNMRAG